MMGITEPLSAGGKQSKSVFDWGFVHLEYARDARFTQLKRLCEQVHKRARAIADDQVMVAFFDASAKSARLLGNAAPPPELVPSLAKFRSTVNAYYIEHYIAFQDVLFVNSKGEIIHSIRKNPAYRENLLSGQLSTTPLAQALAKEPNTETFVDFHHFAAVNAPAAFFIEPAIGNGALKGWYVLQWSLNKINAIFAGSEELGSSGETFLVNRDGFMLTESSFESDSTILKKHLDDSNIQTKFDMRKGRKTVIDYRGAGALSAFEVYRFLDTQWLLVAKMDEAQVLTDHFIQHTGYYHGLIAEHLKTDRQKCDARPIDTDGRGIVRVEMDEFVRVNQGELLQTYGVSTCTAMVAVYPGKFGYLAHISPYDKVYGGTVTNIVGHVLKKIKNYDIYKYERDRVRFIIVARHLESLPQIVDKLLEEGFYLSQISVLHRPDAASANVTCDYQAGSCVVEWRSAVRQERSVFQEACSTNNLGAILKASL